MIVEAADTLWHWTPDTQLEAEFKRVVKRLCGEAAARRTEIAHGLIVGEHRRDRVHYFLVPSYHSSRKRDPDSAPAYTYTSAEIERFKGKFALLATEVYSLGYTILDWRGTLPRKLLGPHTPQS
jgi:hypothetical protein